MKYSRKLCVKKEWVGLWGSVVNIKVNGAKYGRDWRRRELEDCGIDGYLTKGDYLE